MSGRLLAVCVAGPDLLPVPGRRPDRSGIDKKPVGGRVTVHPLGLDGDVQVNRKHHGGEGQAVYAFAQEDADVWAAELDRDLPAGRFGENLRTAGLDLTGAEIGDTDALAALLGLIRAARMIGAECIVTGVQPATAQALVQLGADLTGIETQRNMQQALQKIVGARR